MEELLPYSREATKPERFFSNSITITGTAATGTSTIAERLYKELRPQCPSIRFLSGGGIMRGWARELNMPIKKFAQFNLNHPEKGYDRECDERIAKAGLDDGLLVDARLGYAFVPRAYHVCFVCDFETCVGRRHTDLVKEEPNLSREKVAADMKEREAYDRVRYERLYPGCLWPDQDFNLIIDTGTVSIADAVEQIIANHKFWVGTKGDKIVSDPSMPC